MKTAILAVLLFCIMIFPHELGHFLAARLVRVKVNEFAFGMGPAIWKKQGRETLYSIRLLPIGGFCSLEGEDGDEEDEDAEPGEVPSEEKDGASSFAAFEDVVAGRADGPDGEEEPAALEAGEPGDADAKTCSTPVELQDGRLSAEKDGASSFAAFEDVVAGQADGQPSAEKAEASSAVALATAAEGMAVQAGAESAEPSEAPTGKDGETEADSRSFAHKKPWQKILVLCAGSAMNILCAVLIMALVLGWMGFTTNRIGEVSAGSPAEAAGLQAGDAIVEMNGAAVSDWNGVLTHMPTDGSTFSMRVRRDGETLDMTLRPVLTEVAGSDGSVQQRYVIGITSRISHSPIKALAGGITSTINIGKLIFSSLGMLISGQAGLNDLTGPVGMVQMVSETQSLGMWYFGFLTALICVNLAIINLLPLPALDGGRIIFVIFTAITGRRVSARVEGTIHLVGLVLLMVLMVVVTFHDVTRLFVG